MTWKEKAVEHAKECLPRESCGLLAIVKGKEVYFPCKNLANDQISYFIIDPDDWATAEDSGELVGLIHSHPKGAIFPSEADKSACEYLGLQWHIYSPEIDDWHSFKPTGYKSSKVIGKLMADYIKKEKIEKVAFDRSGYKYHGKIKALADSIRENGVKI